MPELQNPEWTGDVGHGHLGSTGGILHRRGPGLVRARHVLSGEHAGILHHHTQDAVRTVRQAAR